MQHRSTPAPTALVAAGLVTWAAMVAGWMISGGLQAAPRELGLAAVAWGVFPIAFLLVCSSRASRSGDIAMIAIQSACGLGLAALGHGAYSGVLLAVVAGQLGMIVSPPVVAGWVVLQSALAAVLIAQHTETRQAILTSAAYFGFQLFAAGSGRLAKREAEAMRIAERLRISRELHDTVGHHLAALSLHLEVAKNTAPGNEAVLKSQQIARVMLTEVRNVVGSLRDEPGLDLRRALQLLVADVPSPRVHLAIPASLEVTNEAVAHAALRMVQEALTNAVRHARAQNLWVELHEDGGNLKVTVRDDGRGGEGGLQPGHGLTGLRERLQALGGVLDVDTSPGKGLVLHASLPMRRVPT